jgi:hypothetical protein
MRRSRQEEPVAEELVAETQEEPEEEEAKGLGKGTKGKDKGPKGKGGRGARLDDDQLLELAGERWAAEAAGMRWQDRGPPGERGARWRGQSFRPGLNRQGGPRPRWGNRGGRQREKWTSFYQTGIWPGDDQL